MEGNQESDLYKKNGSARKGISSSLRIKGRGWWELRGQATSMCKVTKLFCSCEYIYKDITGNCILGKMSTTELPPWFVLGTDIHTNRTDSYIYIYRLCGFWYDCFETWNTISKAYNVLTTIITIFLWSMFLSNKLEKIHDNWMSLSMSHYKVNQLYDEYRDIVQKTKQWNTCKFLIRLETKITLFSTRLKCNQTSRMWSLHYDPFQCTQRSDKSNKNFCATRHCQGSWNCEPCLGDKTDCYFFGLLFRLINCSEFWYQLDWRFPL